VGDHRQADADGRGLDLFYNSVQQGTLLYASLPRGTFTLPPHLSSDQVLMFVAVGSGITPIMGMLRAIARMRPSLRPLVQLHYASKTPRDIIFAHELAEMDPEQTWLYQWHYLSSEGDRMSADAIVSRTGRMAARAEWYICGPENLKRDLQGFLDEQGANSRRIHSEVFATKGGPAYRLEARGGSGVGGTLQIVETGAVLDVQPQETLLTALERHGYHPEFSCRNGVCGTCKLKVIEGQVDPVGEVLSPIDRSQGFVLSCIARPIGDITIVSGGRPPAGVSRLVNVAHGHGAPHPAEKALVRLVSLIGVGAVLFGAWQLTDHKPPSWETPALAAPAASPTTAAPGTTPATGTAPGATTPTSTKGGGGGTGGGPAPTATKSTGGGGGSGGAPTPTPVKAQPTPTPKPVPTATSTPSPKG
jgi:ferredoxin-NADP reductase